MLQLRLQGHAHCCFTRDGAVLLDLRSDRYSVLPRTESLALASLFGTGTSDADLAMAGQERPAIATALVDRGIATYDSTAGRRFAPVSIELPRGSLLDGARDSVSVRPGHVVNFLAACATVYLALKRRSLQFAIERLRQRKARGAAAIDFDMERATALVQVSRHIRPFIYSPHRRCLFDSLVLAEFLAAYSFYPQLIVGVATQPFRAHCWVQQQRKIFNSDAEDVTQYTPIMAI